MRKGYIAKALFKEGDVRESIRVGEVVRRELPEVDFYNPAENDEINDKNLSLPTPREIFKADTDKIKEADIIIAELDGEDPGVIYEIGLAHGLNIALETIRDIITDQLPILSEDFKAIDTELSKRIPYKSVYPYLSDIRQGTIEGMQELEVSQVRGLLEDFSKTIEEAGEGSSKKIVEMLEALNEEYTQIPPYALNHYVVGGTQEMGSKIYKSAEDAVKGIKEENQ